MRPVVEILLPGAAAWDAATHRALASAPGVLSVDPPDHAGLVRVHLAPLGPRAELRIALAVRWIGEGSVPGLPVIVYDGARPHAVSSTPGRPLRLSAPREERWP
jgi:hypothetical protein